MKKNLVKKIVSISVVALVLALVIVTIVFALVPKRMANPIVEGFDQIIVYQGGSNRLYSYEEGATKDSIVAQNEVYNKIQDLHKDSLKDNLLSAIFQGTGSFKMEVSKKSYSNVVNSLNNEDKNFLVFNYLDEESLVLELNGEVYKDDLGLNAPTVKFNSIIMPLGDSENFEECVVYLADWKDNYKSSYYVTFIAHQAELSEYVAGLNLGIANA